MDPLQNKYGEWKEWLDGKYSDGRVDNNSVSGVIYSLVQEMAVHEAYLALCKFRPKSHLATSLFMRSSSFSYFEIQAIRIRRLTDKNPQSSPKKNRDVYSLRRLVDDIQEQKSNRLMTRRNMCLRYGYPTTVHKTEVENTKMLARTGSGSFSTHLIDAGRFHKTLDKICVKQGALSKTFINELKRRTYYEKNPELKNVRNFVDKYVAHSASDESRRQVLQEIKLSTDEIKHVIKELVECFYILEMFLMRASHSSLIPYGWDTHMNNLNDEEKQVVERKFTEINNECDKWRESAYNLLNE